MKFIEIETKLGKSLINADHIVSIRKRNSISIVTYSSLEEEDGIVYNSYDWVRSPSYEELVKILGGGE